VKRCLFSYFPIVMSMDDRDDHDFSIRVGMERTWDELEKNTGLTTVQLIKRIEQLNIDVSHLPRIEEAKLRSLPRKMVLKYTHIGNNISRVDVYESRSRDACLLKKETLS